jgi:hypothetical protein
MNVVLHSVRTCMMTDGWLAASMKAGNCVLLGSPYVSMHLGA